VDKAAGIAQLVGNFADWNVPGRAGGQSSCSTNQYKRTARRRWQESLELLDRMNPTIEELTAAVEQEANKRVDVLRVVR
jgi:hypothetical protein